VLVLAVALLVGSGVVAGSVGTAQAAKGDSKMTVRTNERGDECYYRPGQLIAPPGMATKIARFTGSAAVRQGPSLVPDRLQQYLPSTVQRLSLYSIGSADPFATAVAMSNAGYTSIAPNYISSFAPVRTWAPGGDSVLSAAPVPVSVGAPTAGKGMRIGVFDTGLERKLSSTIPGTGTVSYLSAQSQRVTLAGLGFIEAGYVQPLELTSGRAAGHGTFITGLLRRALPGATIVVSQVPFSGPADASFGVDPSPTFATNASSRADDAALTFMMYTAFLGSGGVPNIDVLSLSFGSYGCNARFAPESGDGDFRTPLGIRGALLTLWERSGRKLVVASAAGNDSTEEPFYPAAFSASSCFDPSNVLVNGPPPMCEQKDEAVSSWLGGVASTKSAVIGSYSNFGPWANVTAHGSDVVSMLPSMKWAMWSGTSFAAPCAAVFAVQNPGMKWADAAGRLIDCGLAVAAP
jgi:hypothetical protein